MVPVDRMQGARPGGHIGDWLSSSCRNPVCTVHGWRGAYSRSNDRGEPWEEILVSKSATWQSLKHRNQSPKVRMSTIQNTVSKYSTVVSTLH